MSTVSVDFDGVIHRYSKGWHDGTIYDEPFPLTRSALKQLLGDYSVVIHTCREPEMVQNWLADKFPDLETMILDPVDELAIPFWNRRDVILISNKKWPSVAYIDDRAIHFYNWGQALTDLKMGVQR